MIGFIFCFAKGGLPYWKIRILERCFVFGFSFFSEEMVDSESTFGTRLHKFRNEGCRDFVFFWIFFDFFSSFNQVRMYKDFASAPNFMSNGRLAKNGDFYQFLDFVRSQVKSSSK